MDFVWKSNFWGVCGFGVGCPRTGILHTTGDISPPIFDKGGWPILSFPNVVKT